MKRVMYLAIIAKVDYYELNELRPKTHVAGVVGLSKFDSPSI